MFTVQTPYATELEKAVAEKQAGNHQAAIALCQSIICDDLDCAEAYEEIGDNYMSIKQYDKAIVALSKAIELKPESANAHYLLGFAYSAKNLWHESVRELETADRLENNHPEILRCLGWSLYHGENRQQGLIVLERARNLAPEDSFILTDLGICYLTEKQFRKAKGIFGTILQNEPTNTRAQECLKACDHFLSK